MVTMPAGYPSAYQNNSYLAPNSFTPQQQPQNLGAMINPGPSPSLGTSSGWGQIAPANGEGQGGFIQPFDALMGSPAAAMTRVLKDLGIDPSSPDMWARTAMRNADSAWASNLMNLVQGGGMDQAATNPAMFFNSLKSLVQQGLLGGQKVLGGRGPQDISVLEEYAKQGFGQQGMTEGQRLVATLLSDADNAASVASSLLFGGLPGATARALSGPLTTLPTTYEDLAAQNQIGPGTPRGRVTALSVLRDLYGGLYGRFR
jgi:hypothetical protein